MLEAIEETVELIQQNMDKVSNVSKSVSEITQDATGLGENIKVVEDAVNEVETSNQTLVDNMSEQVGYKDFSRETVCIVHGDCLEDAQLLEEKVNEKFAPKHVLINMVGPSIGAHSGPGALGLIYMK